jgi:KUP system potassium uptake protein
MSFAPIITIWFLSLTTISLYRFATHGAEAFAAINPAHIVRFFQNRGPHSWRVLGNVVLVVTGAEALYADMGHFSRPSMMVSPRHCLPQLSARLTDVCIRCQVLL